MPAMKIGIWNKNTNIYKHQRNPLKYISKTICDKLQNSDGENNEYLHI